MSHRSPGSGRLSTTITDDTIGYGIAAGSQRRGPLPDQSMESDMTNPDNDPVSHAQELENIVDELEQKVADDREAKGVPGKPSDRERAPIRGSEDEPPD